MKELLVFVLFLGTLSSAFSQTQRNLSPEEIARYSKNMAELKLALTQSRIHSYSDDAKIDLLKIINHHLEKNLTLDPKGIDLLDEYRHLFEKVHNPHEKTGVLSYTGLKQKIFDRTIKSIQDHKASNKTLRARDLVMLKYSAVDEVQYLDILSQYASSLENPALASDAKASLLKTIDEYSGNNNLLENLPPERMVRFLGALERTSKKFADAKEAFLAKEIGKLYSRLRPQISHRILHLNSVALSAKVRLDLIDEAVDEILISSHVLADDAVGNTLMGKLVAKKQANPDIKIRILVDAWEDNLVKKSKNFSLASRQALESLGIEVYMYRPLKFDFLLNANRRLHDKIFYVKSTIGKLVGGDKNLTKDYYSLSNRSFIGEEIYIEGQAAEDAAAHFRYLLKEKAVQRVGFSGVITPEVQGARTRITRFSKKTTRGERFLTGVGDWRSKIYAVDNITFWSDDVQKKGRVLGTYEAVLDLFKHAKDGEITLSNPYIVLTNEMKSAISDWRKRGGKLNIITGGPMANDMKLVGASWPADRKWLAEQGATIWELPGPGKEATAALALESKIKELKEIEPDVVWKNSYKWNLRDAKNAVKFEWAIHKKVFLHVGKNGEGTVLIGSLNADPRSQYHNLEVLYKVVSDKFAKEVKETGEAELKKFGYVNTVQLGREVANLPGRGCKDRVFAYFLRNLL